MKPIYCGGREITDIFMGGKRITKAYRGDTQVYQAEETWRMPAMSSNNDYGIVLTNSNFGNTYLAFDQNDSTRSAANESTNGWVNIALPYEVELTKVRIKGGVGDKHGAGVIYSARLFTASNQQVPITEQFSVGSGGDVTVNITSKIRTRNIFIYIWGWWQWAYSIDLYGLKDAE